MVYMEKQEAIDHLNELTSGDAEAAHGRADDILVAFLTDNGHPEVAKAFKDAQERCGFYYA